MMMLACGCCVNAQSKMRRFFYLENYKSGWQDLSRSSEGQDLSARACPTAPAAAGQPAVLSISIFGMVMGQG